MMPVQVPPTEPNEFEFPIETLAGQSSGACRAEAVSPAIQRLCS